MNFKKTLLLSTVFILYFYVMLFAQEAIVAIVNNEIITHQDLMSYINMLKIQKEQLGQPQDLKNNTYDLEADALNALIEDKLILSEAKLQNIIVDEEKIDQKVSEIKKGFASEEEFLDYLKSQGLSLNDIRERIKEQFLILAIIDKEVRSNIKISPQEITDFYLEHRDDFWEEEKRDLYMVVLESKGQVYQTQQLLEQAKGTDRLYELITSLKNTIHLGEVFKNEIKKDFRDAVFSQDKGTYSKMIEHENKYYIFFVKDIFPKHKMTLSQAKEQIKNILWNNKLNQKIGAWVEKLRKKANIIIKK